ncbi:MAG: hypothetical protein HRU17_01185 [Polyangiaceae bacterium]|nr:hypothetical protein [Polyangiaceae bacterium]
MATLINSAAAQALRCSSSATEVCVSWPTTTASADGTSAAERASVKRLSDPNVNVVEESDALRRKREKAHPSQEQRLCQLFEKMFDFL